MNSENDQFEMLIANAFQDVRLGTGVSLHETIIIDGYGTEAERAAARVGDELDDWRKLLDIQDFSKITWIGGLPFYDSEGLRFHLPAYLTLAIRDFESDYCADLLENLMFLLTNLSEYNRMRLSILTPKQRSCVHDVLNYLRKTYELDSEELDRAIVEYWATAAP